MDWSDVDDILYDGEKEEIMRLKCPDCGGRIHYVYYPEGKELEVSCKSCGYFSRSHGGPVPNCYKLFLS